MPISDRTRKLLWGRSGNRCAFCRRLLAIDPTHLDDSSVVGEECHIVSGRLSGPRYRELAAGQLDHEDNLVLLCRNDHKRVDDQTGHFTEDRLKAMKLAHEAWVHISLSRPVSAPAPSNVQLPEADDRPRLRIHLCGDATTLLQIVLGADAADFDSDELQDETEVELVADFFALLHQYGEDGADLDPASAVHAKFRLSKEVDKIFAAGFFLFAGRVTRDYPTFKGGVPLSTATIRVKRASDMILEGVRQAEAELAGEDGSSKAAS